MYTHFVVDTQYPFGAALMFDTPIGAVTSYGDEHRVCLHVETRETNATSPLADFLDFAYEITLYTRRVRIRGRLRRAEGAMIEE